MKWLDILKVIAPAVLAVIPGAQPVIPLVLAGMTLAEESGKSGSDKKAIAVAAVQVGATAVNTIKKEEIIPVDAAVDTATKSIDAVVAATNLVHNLVSSTKEDSSSSNNSGNNESN
jgi:hypothetical protein